MLAWEFFVHKEDVSETGKAFGPILAAWRIGYEGIDWLKDLAREGQIADLESSGYPTKFSAAVKFILPVLEEGFAQKFEKPEPIIDNQLPKSWHGKLMINRAEFDRCKDTDLLLIEAWDQS